MDWKSISEYATINDICRICALNGDNMLPIFGPEETVLFKIHKHLPIHVTDDDNLPKQICSTCLFKLNVCQEIQNICLDADKKLRIFFGSSQSDEIKIMQIPSIAEEMLDMKSRETADIIEKNDFSKTSYNNSENTQNYTLPHCYCRKTNLESANTVLREVAHDQFKKKNEVGCEICDGESRSEKGICNQQKSERSTILRPYGCEICDKSFSSLSTLSNHLETHSHASSYLCDLCGKSFKSTSNLSAHKRIHLPEEVKKKHVCKECGKAFRSSFHLSEHSNTHTGHQPYACHICKKCFHNRVQLRQHSLTHTTENMKMECTYCGRKFNRRSNLKRHLACHLADRKFTCAICKATFTTLSEMLSHRYAHRCMDELSVEMEAFTCDKCGKTLAKKEYLVSHLRLHAGQKLPCKLCGKLLSTKASLRYHITSHHSKQRKFQCQFCGEGFMCRDLQLMHERIHTGEKPYKCQRCEKAFRSSSYLKQHMVKHSAERQFECIHCRKRFSRKGSMLVHVRTHMGDRPFACGTCNRHFSQKNDMLKHERTHVSEACRFPCDECPASFVHKKLLEKHKVLNHGLQVIADVRPVMVATSGSEVVSQNVTEIITQEGQTIIYSNVH